MPAVHKIAISRKTKSVGTFCQFFLNSMYLWHYQSNYSKDSKSTNFDMNPPPSKTLGDHPRKDNGVKMVLSYRLQQNVSVELHMI